MAIRITRVYTRGGDAGKTSLVGGIRVDKDCRKLDSYGTVDELLCLVGAARTAVAAIPVSRVRRNAASRAVASGSARKERSRAGTPPLGVPADPAALEARLRRIQNRLFDAGSILATPAGQAYPGMPELSDADVSGLERDMDDWQSVLPALDSFVLPGGTDANAALHQCRAVCRRAERETLRLAREEAVPAIVLKYLNRLSDWFFVMARYAAWLEGAPEYLWEYAGGGGGSGKDSRRSAFRKRRPPGASAAD
jgi:cob(I)alamin adenosyltransferase